MKAGPATGSSVQLARAAHENDRHPEVAAVAFAVIDLEPNCLCFFVPLSNDLLAEFSGSAAQALGSSSELAVHPVRSARLFERLHRTSRR